MRYFLIISLCFFLIVFSCSKKSNNPQPTQQTNNNTNSSGCFYSFSQSVKPYVALVSPDGIDSTYSIDSLPAPFPIIIYDKTAKYIYFPGEAGMDLSTPDSMFFIGIDIPNPNIPANTKGYLAWKTLGTTPSRSFIIELSTQVYNIQYGFYENNDSITIQYGFNNVSFDNSSDIDIVYTDGNNFAYANAIYGNINNPKDTCINVSTIAALDSTNVPALTISTSIPTGTTFTFHKLK